MATEEDRQEERDRLGNEPLQAPPAAAPAAPQPGNDDEPVGEREEEESANGRAAASSEPPQVGTRSTEGLTVGGSEATRDLAPAEEATRRQREMEESGEEAPA